ncbi:MAG: phosphonate ABC transporter, permease protein PhnE [Planctomycetota bacterium]|nr:phosphonate ABC transporter, permease protein PhnE [Planctomycetota bacterium]MCX8039506.1 phosphonate ABC transporter, permease protein PhnE [Planctomycetota bacterium]MDW8373025.1 phosphonate ABC transporter, permease protein PhnE [Planctomycetota bacterium]
MSGESATAPAGPVDGALPEELRARLRPPRSRWRAWRDWLLLAGFAALMVWAWHGAEMRPLDLVVHSGNIAKLAGDFVPPDFRDWRHYLDEMVVTVHIALWGTFLAVLASVPCGLLSAANLTPWWIHQPMRRLMDAARAINELIFALLFIVAVGLGPFAGVLALFVHTTGILAKLFSEVVEAIDPRPVEGVRATGGSRLAEIRFGVIPQVLPLWVSYALYRFESNVRSATVIGIVGAGGIGMVLHDLMASFLYQKASAVLIIVVVTVVLIDIASAQLRKLLV